MKKISAFLLVVLFAIAAVIWLIRVVVDVVYGVPDISVAVFLLDILCALVWIIAFCVQVFRWRASRKDK